MASLSMDSVTYDQPQTKNIKEKIPERNNPCFKVCDSMSSLKKFIAALLYPG